MTAIDEAARQIHSETGYVGSNRQELLEFSNAVSLRAIAIAISDGASDVCDLLNGIYQNMPDKED
jgi:hypothetical protein